MVCWGRPLVLVLYLLVNISSGQLIFATFGVPICSDDNPSGCPLGAALRYQLSEAIPSVSNSWRNYMSPSNSSVSLTYPLSVNVTYVSSQLVLQLQLFKTAYNAYELFEYTESCPISFNIGSCFDPKTAPPDDPRGEKGICCVDSKRGWGQHCLRYDYTVPYPTVDSVHLLNVVNVTVSNGPDTRSFILSTFEPHLPIYNFCDSFLTQGVFPPEIQAFATDTFSRLLSRPGWPTTGAASRSDWFLIQPADPLWARVGMTASFWATVAECSDEIDSDTKTNDEHPKNQFARWSTTTLGNSYPDVNFGSARIEGDRTRPSMFLSVPLQDVTVRLNVENVQ